MGPDEFHIHRDWSVAKRYGDCLYLSWRDSNRRPHTDFLRYVPVGRGVNVACPACLAEQRDDLLDEIRDLDEQVGLAAW